MLSPVTIVLPLHNAERTIRPLVARIMELAHAPHRQLTLALIDDGSTDDTFEAACELSRDYPQVMVFRQPFQAGLGPALEQVRRRLDIDEAIVHDGIGEFDLEELSALIQNNPRHAPAPTAAETPAEHRGSRRFAAVSALNARMAEAHRAVSSFHWLRLGEPARPRRRAVPLTSLGSVMTAGVDVPAPLF